MQLGESIESNKEGLDHVGRSVYILFFDVYIYFLMVLLTLPIRSISR